jgi:hypothetical protein
MDPWDDPSVHTKQLRRAKGILGEAGIEAQLHEPSGDPARAIERKAEEGG